MISTIASGCRWRLPLLGLLLCAAVASPAQGQDALPAVLEGHDGLEEAERAHLRESLEACRELGVDAELMADLEQRALALADEGISPRRLLDKVLEGRRKGLDGSRVTLVVQRMEDALRQAHALMDDAVALGVRPHPDPRLQEMLLDGLVVDGWRGLRADEMRRLLEGAQRRMASGLCTAVDLAAAAETATGMIELGADRPRVVQLCADALGAGYAAEELRAMGRSLSVADRSGAPAGTLLEQMAEAVHGGRPWRETLSRMVDEGWLDSDELGDRGAMHGPVDDILEMGPGHYGQPGDDGAGGGSSGSGGSGGGGGGHRGGQ